MNSKLKIEEFREKLRINTKIGTPELRPVLGIFSVFSDNSKCFYGNFNESTFKLVKNTNFKTTFYVLRGNYQNIENNLKLSYVIEPSSKLGIIWIKFFPFIALIGSNFYFLNDKSTPKQILILVNVFIFFTIVFSRWNLKREKKYLENKFNKIFEIVN